MESMGDLAAALPGNEDTEVHDFLLRLRQAYESDMPLYPLHHIQELLDFAAYHKSCPYGLDPSYIGIDFFGDKKRFTFSESALQYATLDLSSIQWLICMPYLCSDSRNILTRAFSLRPMDYGDLLGPSIPQSNRTRCFQRRLTDAQQIWKQSKIRSRIEGSIHRALRHCYVRSHQPFTKILAIGLGYHDPYGWVFGQQHAFVLDLSHKLQGPEPNLPEVEVVFQDHTYCDINMKTALEMLGPSIKVIRDKNFRHVFSFDDSTLIIALNHLKFPLKEIIADYATIIGPHMRMPRAIIWEQGVPITWEEMEGLASRLNANPEKQCELEFRQDSPRTNRLEALYDKLEFPASQKEDDEDNPFQANNKLTLYMRKE
ncbi:hypothetical protein F5B22DRAFT_598574 [Xylaria bambusicola]|uniref:uncharacterized protein n=1 Tax=Xylaria bambusicola TaxID=326684 RepID=UPI0020080C8D|nr:uncharacterized protein F5B22DRAFT_598574 [Xylaria bambusicola]KAI0520837.1 hypothetical protein F5B22DRAFT_598574 [Xylaria bambusicola]